MKFNWNNSWFFTKDAALVSEKYAAQNMSEWESVTLPHTWNAQDGQDGGNDYYRGTCYYAKRLAKADCGNAEEIYIEFEGANSSADVYVNGKPAVHHDGGYSTWRVDITDALDLNNLMVIAVDNQANETVYPQMADFTFYGGIYRNVNIIAVSESHFDLEYYGGPGIMVTPKPTECGGAAFEIETFVKNIDENFCFDKDNDIKAEIASVIGLDFEQFLRTVMLSQGEFTKFLNSSDNDKADNRLSTPVHAHPEIEHICN